MEIENEILTFIANDEGRIRPIAGSVTEFKYEYDIKDHLGNVRMTITPDNNNVAQIIQEDSYYPFGLKIAGMTMISGTENKYTYNGKEPYSSKFIIQHSQFTICEATDPADEFHSPYVYCANNPIMLVDPDGCVTFDVGTQTWLIEEGDTFSSISNELGFSNEELQSVNPQITDIDKINAGEVINVPQIERIQALQWAYTMVNVTNYGYEGSIDNFGPKTNKCNKLMSDAYEKGANIDFPNRKRFNFLPTNSPVGANTLADKSRNNVGSFYLTKNPKIGDSYSWSNDDGSGHTVIKVLNNMYIGAFYEGVTIRSMDYLIQKGYSNPTIRTYRK